MFSFDKSSLGLTEEEIKKAEAGGQSGGKFMDPGIHAVKIVAAEHYAGRTGSIYSESDPTWIKLQVTYENLAGAQKKAIIMLPTSKLTYKTAAGKETPFLFVKFKQFCASLGIAVSADAATLTKVMKNYFANPKKLIGLTSEIRIAYEKPYRFYISKDNYEVRDASGKILIPGPLTKDEADIAAANRGLTLQSFPDIVDMVNKVKDEPKPEAVAAPKEDEW